MKKILIYAPNAPTSGVTNALYSLHKGLDKQKFRISVISWPEKIKMQKLAKEFNGSFYPFKLFYYKHPIAFRKELKNIFKNNEIDTVIFNLSYMTSLVPISLAKKYNIKNIIVHSHSSRLEANNAIKRIVLTVIHYINRFRAKKYTFTRLACSQKAGIWLFSKGTNFTVIKNAIDLARFRFDKGKREKIRQQFNLSDEFVLGNIGRLTFPKNQKFLIGLFEEVLKKVPNAYLWIIGDGPLMGTLKEEAKHLKLTERIVFWGNQNNIEDFLNAMDLFIMPSIFEGLPVAAIEAQTNGIPCIPSDSIDSSVIINDNLVQKSLSDSYEEWVSAVIKQLQTGRYDDVLNSPMNHGWDIKDAVKQLEQFYLR